MVRRKSLCDITATKRAAKGEGANPMDLEWLRKGSEFHKVSPSGNDFSIQAVDKSDITLEGFHMIVQHAVAGASAGGYYIMPHLSNSDPKGRWDFAVIAVS
jgi:hypothetical protein